MDRRHFIKLSATAAAAILSGVSNPALAEKVLPKTSAIDLEIDSYTVLFGGYHIPDPKDFRVGDIYIDQSDGRIWTVQEVALELQNGKLFRDLRFVEAPYFGCSPKDPNEEPIDLT